MKPLPIQNGTQSHRAPAGFSLIELLIVVAIILIIAAIAIPNLLHAKMAANESAAVFSLRAINTASVSYSTTYGNGYAPSLGALGGTDGGTATCVSAEILDSVLSNNGSGNTSKKSGYIFTFTPGPANTSAATGCTLPGVTSFYVTALPITVSYTGQRGFFIDQTGVIRFSTDGTAPTLSNPAIQ
jgi:type IV pilus assembly protein PilA